MKWYKFWCYENLGNAKDGWEFNDRWETGIVFALPWDDDRFTEKDMKTIIRRAVFKPTFRARLELEYNDGSSIYVIRERDGYCYGELEEISEEDVDNITENENDYVILFDKMLRNAARRRP